METFISFTNQSQGRDRLFRATQYACALLKYLLRNEAKRKDLVKKLQFLESNMSSGRKLFRLGNTVNSIHAVKSTLNISDPVLRFCLSFANLNRALYFICDNILWARSIGLIRDIDKERWSLNSTRFYFLSLVMNLTRDVYVIIQLMVQKSRDRHYQRKIDQHLNESPDVACVIVPQLDAFLFLLLDSLRNEPSVALDTLKNVCDLFIPLDKLGIYQTNAGVVGFCGLISSLLGILSVLRPSLKIKP
ncbi:peroxisomal membrane protein 11A-like [Carassius auratus]|uniref:Peroxisomal membrane protein 11A-like n=1 Tax=Carassius auratus TaxID=7957 RepID=A0A6P6LQB6_CARAU|nr:peroxisomal membrane protein 11A-like [Carassius auratus]XP_026086679.1 peroxisomal membrane protein 11A-like [Carassius auratus]